MKRQTIYRTAAFIGLVAIVLGAILPGILR
jgi:hypothetical protein